MVQKIYSKMHPVSYASAHPDVTDLVNREMVKNTKSWISWEWNITFLWNKKILNLCLRGHILRSYLFVVEVIFRSERHNVFTEEIIKIALISNNNKRLQSVDSTETYAYGTSKDLGSDEEE